MNLIGQRQNNRSIIWRFNPDPQSRATIDSNVGPFYKIRRHNNRSIIWRFNPDPKSRATIEALFTKLSQKSKNMTQKNSEFHETTLPHDIMSYLACHTGNYMISLHSSQYEAINSVQYIVYNWQTEGYILYQHVTRYSFICTQEIDIHQMNDMFIPTDKETLAECNQNNPLWHKISRSYHSMHLYQVTIIIPMLVSADLFTINTNLADWLQSLFQQRKKIKIKEEKFMLIIFTFVTENNTQRSISPQVQDSGDTILKATSRKPIQVSWVA